ncbi:hypothetical protein X766_15895 [Mesorhizobium sp. LSJC255A00]|uniref:hypothetical protein n=1 Tax=Mesorhizobium sp. LSJC255A00 TaxID=1287313 RepID=UPI0003CEC4E8|nr:hypothetical protein [Mesorhizobium sp. LSJC255A00]ESX17878.1 hypothetical protein X766_15895 [Mesorhizobium sp. LSJC255A00]
MTLTLTACGTNKRILEKAGSDIGKSQAGVHLAPWPQWCKELIEHAQLNTVDDTRILLRRERRQVKKGNVKLIYCAEYYEKYAALLSINANAAPPALKSK